MASSVKKRKGLKSLLSTSTLRESDWKRIERFPDSHKINVFIDDEHVRGSGQTILSFLNTEFQSVYFREITQDYLSSSTLPVLAIMTSFSHGRLSPSRRFAHLLGRDTEVTKTVPMIVVEVVDGSIFDERDKIADPTYPLVPATQSEIPELLMVVEMPLHSHDTGYFPKIGDTRVTDVHEKINMFAFVAISQWLAKITNSPEIEIPRPRMILSNKIWRNSEARREYVRNFYRSLSADVTDEQAEEMMLKKPSEEEWFEPIYDMSDWVLTHPLAQRSSHTQFASSSSMKPTKSSSVPSTPSSDSAKRQRIEAQIAETQALLGVQMRELRRINTGEVQPGFSLHA
jgi:hypothetical protein